MTSTLMIEDPVMDKDLLKSSFSAAQISALDETRRAMKCGAGTASAHSILMEKGGFSEKQSRVIAEMLGWAINASRRNYSNDDDDDNNMIAAG